jgi:hypothetical protein
LALRDREGLLNDGQIQNPSAQSYIAARSQMGWRGFGFVRHSRTIFCRAVPNPKMPRLSIFLHRRTWCARVAPRRDTAPWSRRLAGPAANAYCAHGSWWLPPPLPWAHEARSSEFSSQQRRWRAAERGHPTGPREGRAHPPCRDPSSTKLASA